MTEENDTQQNEGEKVEVPNMLTDLEDEKFTETPSVAVTTDDLVVAMTLNEYTSFLYTRCDSCFIRRFGCDFYQSHDTCQIERNLLREHLRDLQREGAGLRDKALVLASFIQLKELWRSAAKIAVYHEDYEMDAYETGSKIKLEISKFLHKSVNDHTKQLLSVLKELAATRKERIKQSGSVKGGNDIESFSVFLANMRDNKVEEE